MTRQHRPAFHADQQMVASGRRINDMLAVARDIASLTDYRLPLELAGEDRVMVAMLLPETGDPAAVLASIIGELHQAEAHRHDDDHNAGDPAEAELHEQAAADAARDAVLADAELAARRAAPALSPELAKARYRCEAARWPEQHDPRCAWCAHIAGQVSL